MSDPIELWRPYRLSSSLRRAIEKIRPILEDCEPRAVAERRFPLEGIEAMMDAGLFRLALAKEVGGEESHPVIEMEVYEAIARISVSAAWNLLVGNIHTSWASAYLSDEAVAAIFPAGHRTVVAGQAAPVGKGRKVDGGYRVTGRYSWGSGMTHCEWVLGGFKVEGDNRAFTFVVPKASVTVLDNWHVIGIEGSGSFDYTVQDLFVPEGYSFDFLNPVCARGGPRFTLPWRAQASVPHSAVALGGAEHAFEAIARLAGGKRRMLQEQTLASRGAFQRDMGETYIRLCAARDNAVRLFEHMTERALNGPPLNTTEAYELQAMAAHSCQLATEVASLAFRYGGGSSVRLDSPIQRALRDVLVAQQHVAVADTSFDELGVAIVNQVAGST
jgi:indole-3-acetate monooxygenase